MTDELQRRAVRGRAAKQERSERTRAAIVEAVLAVLADVGIAGLTHRLVAERSDASLAATTYYFESKSHMIAEASNQLLRGYLGRFEEMADSVTGGGAPAFRAFVAEVSGQAMDEHRAPTLAWCEIMLDGARHAEARELARLWFARMTEVWCRAARAFGIPDPDLAGRSGLDLTLGALLYGLGLGLGSASLKATIAGPVNPTALFPPPETQTPEPRPAASRAGTKAAATRERILEAAIELLASRGAGAVNYRTVAEEAGLTPGAPAYHFASSEAMLAQAQALLFARSKARYEELMTTTLPGLDLATMIELIAVIFQSEATEFGAANLATYAIWLQAAREREIGDLVRDKLTDLYRIWNRSFANVGAPIDGPEPLLAQYLFVGGLLRSIACGVTARDLVASRTQLKADLVAIVEGRHWAQSAVGQD